jgi:hypothetical protein
MAWQYMGGEHKSMEELQKLVDMVQSDDFNIADLKGFRATTAGQKMDRFLQNNRVPTLAGNGWQQGTVRISLPCDGVRHSSEASAPVFEVNGIYYRRPLDVIKMAFATKDAEEFHLFPYEMYWKPSEDAPEERIYTELFTGDVFIDEYLELRSMSRNDERDLEPVVAGIIFYSDSTQLTHFSAETLWPVYMYIGNQPKNTRAKAAKLPAHHIAYIPKVGRPYPRCSFSKLMNGKRLA